MCKFLLFLSLLFISFVDKARAYEVVENELPYSFSIELMDIDNIDDLNVSPIDVQLLVDEDNKRYNSLEPQPLKFAHSIEVNAKSNNIGTLETVNDSGLVVWRVKINSPNALSINLHLDEIELPEGSKIWIYGESSFEKFYGPYVNSDWFDGNLWTPIVEEESVIVEVVFTDVKKWNISIPTINAGFRLFGKSPKRASCQVDIECPIASLWKNESRSVALYTHSGKFACSGTLLNSENPTLDNFFLTANHCINNQSEAKSLILYWNHEASSCGSKTTKGHIVQKGPAIFLSGWDRKNGTDFTLLRIAPPPSNANVFYSGWSIGFPGVPVVGIHHPRGDFKSFNISTAERLYKTDYGNPFNDYISNGKYWRVQEWEYGIVENISSGSGLWGSDRYLIGQLTGAVNTCKHPVFSWYGSLKASWEGGGTIDTSLKPWLKKGLAGGEKSIQGFDPKLMDQEF